MVKNMKKITDEYANEVLEPILTKYIEDENIIELYNAVVEADEDLLSLALFFAQRVDITKYLDGMMNQMPDLDKQTELLVKQLNENIDTIDKVSNIIAFDDDRTKQIMDILSKTE